MIYSLWEGGAEGGSPFWPCTVTSAEFINKSNRQKCALAVPTCYIVLCALFLLKSINLVWNSIELGDFYKARYIARYQMNIHSFFLLNEYFLAFLHDEYLHTSPAS